MWSLSRKACTPWHITQPNTKLGASTPKVVSVRPAALATVLVAFLRSGWCRPLILFGRSEIALKDSKTLNYDFT